MKIVRLRVKNFLGIVDADLDLSRPMNLVLGINGSGKSSCRDAVLWCLTGRCRGTDAAGRGAAQLIRRGATSAAVELTVRDHRGVTFVVTRTRDGAAGVVSVSCPDDGTRYEGRAAECWIEVIAGAGPDAIEIVLDPLRFLDLDGRTQSSLLAGAIGLRLSSEDLVREAAAFGVSVFAADAMLRHFKDALGHAAGSDTIGPEQMEAARQTFYNRRRDHKKGLASLEEDLRALPSGPIPTAEAVAEARRELDEISGLDGAARERLGMARRRQTEWAKLRVRKDQIEEQTLQLEAQAKAGEQPQPGLDLLPSVADLEQEVAKLKETWSAADDAEGAARLKRVQAEEELKAAWDQVSQARDGDTSCPAGVTDDPCPVLVPRIEERKAQVPELTAVAKKIEATVNKAHKAEEARKAEAKGLLQELGAKEQTLQAAREAAARSAGHGAAEWDLLQNELDRIAEELSSPDDPSVAIVREEQALLDLALRKQEAETRARHLEMASGSAGERARLQERIAKVRSEVDLADELTKALDPKALPAKILQSRIGPVQDGLNQVLSEITGGQYQVTLEAGEKGVELNVWKQGAEHPLFITLLSHSERLRLGTAISIAFALVTPLRILAIDEVDLLLQEPRSLLKRALADLIMPDGDLETILMFRSASAPEYSADTDRLAVFWVEDGKVEELKAAREVTA